MKKGGDHLHMDCQVFKPCLTSARLPRACPFLSIARCVLFIHSLTTQMPAPIPCKARDALHWAPHVLVGQEPLSLGRMQTPDLFLWFSGASGKSTGFGSKQPGLQSQLRPATC